MKRGIGLVLSVGLLVISMGMIVPADDATFDDDSTIVSDSSGELYDSYITFDRNGIVDKGDWQDYKVKFLVSNISNVKIDSLAVYGSLLDENDVVVDRVTFNGNLTGPLEPGQSGYEEISFDASDEVATLRLDEYILEGEGDYLVRDENDSMMVSFSNPVYVSLNNNTAVADDSTDSSNMGSTSSLEQRISELEKRVAKLEEMIS